MARYWLADPAGFVFTSRSGLLKKVDIYSCKGRVFDTVAGAPGQDGPAIPWDLPSAWTPPPYGLSPMDTDAQTALNAARAPYAGRQLPGVGTLLANEPLFQV